MKVPMLIECPTPRPMTVTSRTAAAVGRCDRAAAMVLRGCWHAVNAALFVAVWLILRVARWHDVAAADRSGYQPDRRSRYPNVFYAFHCGWCGSDTRENERFARSCCRLANLEFWRRREGWS